MSTARERVVVAAHELFARHGVGGTSLQMIADTIGVTKAAVYHQFPTKDEIVLAVAAAELARVEALVAAAEAEPDPERARQVLVAGMVDLAVQARHMEGSLVGDPVLNRHFARDPGFARVMGRLYAVLVGPDADTDARLAATLLTAAIGGAAMHPLVAGLSDEVLRAQLAHLATRLLDR